MTIASEKGPELVSLPKGSRVTTGKPDRRKGVWISHKADLHTVTPHASELAALRDAVNGGKTVVFVPFGSPIPEATS